MPAGTYARLRALKQRSGFSSLPPPPPTAPDGMTLSLGETRDGKRYDLRTYPLGEIPEPLGALFSLVYQAGDDIRHRPFQILRGSASLERSSFALEEPISLRVKLENTGTAAMKLDNPLREEEGALEGILKLYLGDFAVGPPP